jgi:hypothetical protein
MGCNPEDEGDKFLRNVGNHLQDWVMSKSITSQPKVPKL